MMATTKKNMRLTASRIMENTCTKSALDKKQSSLPCHLMNAIAKIYSLKIGLVPNGQIIFLQGG